MTDVDTNEATTEEARVGSTTGETETVKENVASNDATNAAPNATTNTANSAPNETRSNVVINAMMVYNDPDGYVPNDEEKNVRAARNKALTAEVNTRVMFLEEMYQVLRGRLGDQVQYTHLFNIIRKLITEVEMKMKAKEETSESSETNETSETSESAQNTESVDNAEEKKESVVSSREDNIDNSDV